MKKQFYNPQRLLNTLDINKQKPEVFLVTSNRSAGKTTAVNKFLVEQFLKHKKKFMILYRFTYELDQCADKFFKDIGRLFFQNHAMTNIARARGSYHELFLDDRPCGYAVAINAADQIKKCSHLLSDTDYMVMDEFQSETNHYCPNEVNKFMSIHTSVARGGGDAIRYVPCILLGNTVTLLNPYFIALGISDKLMEDTKILRGDGFIVEQYYNPYASHLQETSAFNRAFSRTEYVGYAAQNIYLNDNMAFVETIKGKNNYLCTLKYMGQHYGVYEYPELGVLYCTNKADISFPIKIVVTTDDHQINYIMLKKNDAMIQYLRQIFNYGCFRFKNISSKQAILSALTY